MPVVVTIRKASPLEEPIRRAAEAMEPAIREAFLAAVERLRAAVSVDKLLTYLARGDVNGALAYLAVDRRFAAILQGAGEAGLGAFRAALQRSFGAGALAAANEVPRAATVRAAFDLANPKAVSFLQRYAFDLIKQVSKETRDAIKQTVLRAFREGGHPYQQARTIQRNLGLTTTQEQAVANYRTALENGQYREALQRALRDGRYDASLLRAQRDGTRLAQARIDKMVERYRQRFIQYRARNIARTESLRAANAGQLELWRQARENDLLPGDAEKEWIVSGDERTCPECMALDGTAVPLDEEFAPGVMAPPDPHPQCRCSMKLSKKTVLGFNPADWEAA